MAAYDLRDGCLWSTCSSKFCRKSLFLRFSLRTRLPVIYVTAPSALQWLLLSYVAVSTAAPELLLVVLGLQNPNFGDMVGFFDLPLSSVCWSPGFFELPFVCLVFTSHVALRFVHAVVVLFLGFCHSCFSSLFLGAHSKKGKRGEDKQQHEQYHWHVQVAT